LIGASFGLSLRRVGFDGEILGVSSPLSADSALRAGAIDRVETLAGAAGRADLIFLSSTIGRILDTVRRLDPLVRPEALVTDAGSTKCEIVDMARETLRRCQFLGGHPMAGKESRGAESADAALFAGRTWVLTPDDSSELETPAARDFRFWLARMGARLSVLDCDAHDRVVALTSHLPQLASTGLASLVGDLPQVEISGSGLMDMTRLAGSSYDLWRDILATNYGHIDGALSEYIQKLEHMRENLRTRQLQLEFERGAALAGRLRRSL
jgi:prephenate dehydrogenase